jgi:cellulose synthase operon protein C
MRGVARVVQTYLLAGNFDGARSYVEDLAAGRPDEPGLAAIRAGLLAMAGETAEAEAAYRALLDKWPDFAPGHEALYGLLAAEGRLEEAETVLEGGLAATDEDARLMFIEAGAREARGDFGGAIAIYEALYARDTSSTLIANNLASLIATHRSDPESLERAFAIARRLRGTEVPQFADTYGWILARRGEHAEALPYLERAAAALPHDALVQYHLGVTQHHLGRVPEARASLERALAAAGPDSDLPQMAEARTLMAALETASGDVPKPPAN